ncbi:MAG: ABC transporter ATP-binding protein [Clostridia bacterium]|nr:ABC transporter ATP-binding protein [Clostridia bacterium]
MMYVKNLYYSYNSQFSLRDINFHIEEGSFSCILGPNGSGKTTLLKILSGIKEPIRGDIFFQGKPLFSFGRREIAKNVAVVPQGAEINFDFTVHEMVLMGRTPHVDVWRGEGSRDYGIVEEAMGATGTLGLAHRRMSQLSGGEKQRVVIARALAQEPKLLLLDEPTTHLDMNHQLEIFDILKRLNQDRKLTVVVILHDLNLAGLYCEKFFMLNQGGLAAAGSPEDLLDADLIHSIYGVNVEIIRHPHSGNPYILPLALGRNGER